MNKYNQCISTPPTNTSCNQYKVLADKYLNAYRRCHNYTYYRYYCYYKKLYEKCQAATPPPVKKGNVCSTVYEDENENDKQDSNEKGTSGIKITLIDINGDSYTTTTDNKGNYCFKNIPEGKASVTLDLNSLPQDADHTVGYVMDDVTVVGCKTICAPKDGYVMPAPVLLGKACGRVILDGKGIKDVTVTIKDINGQEHNGTTDKCGNYCISGIPEGDANVTVDETTLPANIEQTGGENPNPVTIIGDKKVNAGVDCYNTIKSGSVVGFVYIDYNGDATFGGRDIPVIGVQITVTVGVEEFTTVTGADGKYKLDDVPAGEAEIKVNEVFIKDKFGGVITLSEGFNPSQITVVAGETVDAGNDGFCIAKY
jgi:serine-aspartate repeat-containing protein C/D/E